MNHYIENDTYHYTSLIIWLIQFISHILTSTLNPGIPSRKNFLPIYVKKNNINLCEDNSKIQICRLCNIVVDTKDGVSHCDQCDLCIIGKYYLFIFLFFSFFFFFF